jgi:hypothetical protein
MTYLVFLVYVVPFIVLFLVLVHFIFLRTTPRERALRIFSKISAHPNRRMSDLPKLIEAVRCGKVAYLRKYLNGLSKRVVR